MSADLHADRAIQRRILAVLSAGQVLSGVGLGAGVSLGALLLADVAGDESVSGLAATAGTLGAAVFAIPLARLAAHAGRRPALSTGAAIAAIGAVAVIGSAALRSPLLLIAALMVLGAGNAVNLQARFAAVDLASARHRGRDLSIVVWTTTVGIVVGPNLVTPGQALGDALGLPDLTGPFLITVACQLLAALLYLSTLRPDPLRASLREATSSPTAAVRRGLLTALRSASPGTRRAIAIVALSHATMVAVMAMTPVHLTQHGASLTVVGLTISLHTLGMFGLSPLFGWLSDRVGRLGVVFLGQGILALALLTGALGGASNTAVTVALILLGLGWSASTVAGSAMIADSARAEDGPSIQGLSDLSMNLAGAAGGALAGVVLALIGYAGLNLVALLLVAAAVVFALRSHSGLPAATTAPRSSPADSAE